MLRPERVTLEGQVVRLEPLEERHRDDLLAAAAEDPHIWDFMGTTLPGADAWPAYLAAALAPEFVAWATVERATSQAVGSTRFGDIEPEHGRVEIGWTWIAQDWQRTYVNTEAKLLMLTHAFEIWKCNRVEFKTDFLNERSRNAILRLGAKQEGIFRQHIVCQSGRLRDSVYFSIINSEWEEVKKNLEAKLKER